MKKLYVDQTKNDGCVGYFVKGAELIPAGTTVSSMPVREKNDEYRRYAEEYDIHFIFDDHVPVIDFYTVPWVDIMAEDSDGGLIGMIGQNCDLESGAPVCYISRDRRCYQIAENGAAFLEKVREWKNHMTVCNEVVFYPSRKDAGRKLEFFAVKEG